MSRYDVVVIGAGNGGLTAAATLAKAGRKVLLLERHNIPGGCATSFCRGRFEFEVALHQLSGLGRQEMPGPVRGALQDLGVMEKVEFVEMKDLFRAIYLDHVDITLPADWEGMIAVLKEKFPKEKEQISKFFDMVQKFCMEMIGGIFMNDPDISKEKYPLYFKHALRNSKDVLDEYFHDPALKAVISTYWGYMGLPPGQLAFMHLAILVFAYCVFKPWHIKGSSQALSNALVEVFLEKGGDVRFNCPVKKILVKNGRITGVLTDDGETYETDFVISNASPISVYVDLIDADHVPDEQFNILRGAAVSTSAFTIYAGLDCEPQDIGIAESTNFICSSIDIEAAYARTRTLDPPEMMLLSCYDVSDPDFSPKGACQTAIVTGQYVEPWLAVPPGQYAEMKYRYAEGMLALVERVFPGYRDHIEEIEVATPLTHMRYLGHPGGAIYGFDQHVRNSRLFMPLDSPIEGLYFAGASVAGGGYQPTLTSGGSAARAVSKAIQKREGGK